MNKQQEQQIAQIMADNIIKAIESGKGNNWLKPWSGGKFANIISGKAYKSFNPLMCHFYNLAHGYTSNFFITVNATFKMAKASGEHWKIDNPKQYNIVSLSSFFEKEEEQPNGETKKKKVWFYKAYRVYNIEQIEGWQEKFADYIAKHSEQWNEHQPIEQAEMFVNNYLESEAIVANIGGPRAFYSPGKDVIGMPNIKQFVSPGEYYSTFLHEIAHSTGHESRLNRFKPSDKALFGNDTYSKEELIAEFAAQLLCYDLGISDSRLIENSEQYLAGWGKRFKENPEILFEAALLAQKAAKYVTKTVTENQTVTA